MEAFCYSKIKGQMASGSKVQKRKGNFSIFNSELMHA